MARRNTGKRNKALVIFETIVLVILAIVFVISLFVAKKFSLVNRVELNQESLLTSDEYNNGGNTAWGGFVDKGNEQQETDLSNMEMIALVGVDTRDEMDGLNSDTMIIAVLNHNEKTIKLISVYRDTYLNMGHNDYGIEYSKANAAYNMGGPEAFLSMLNLNLDLNITDFATVDFSILSRVIEDLGGLDIDLTREEVIHLNNYNVETSEAAGMDYVEVELPDQSEFDGAMTRTFHLNGSQSVSYARIRYTQGNDFRRAARQRLVIEKTLEKAKQAGWGTMNSILNTVLPAVTTNLETGHIINLAKAVLSYNITDQTGFPFEHLEDDGTLTGEDTVIPVTLERNVIELHEFIMPGVPYTPSETVIMYSNYIIAKTGYGEEDIPTNSETGEIPTWTQELQDEQDALVAAGLMKDPALENNNYSSYSDDSYSYNNYYSDNSYSDDSYNNYNDYDDSDYSDDGTDDYADSDGESY